MSSKRTNKEELEIIWRNILWLCRKRGINQTELAKKAEIGLNTLSNIVRGYKKPHIWTLVKIARALEIDSVKLLWRENMGKEFEPSTVGEKVCFLCIERRINQLMLSELSGINRQTISDLMDGKRTAQKKTLVRIAKALDVKVEDLYPKGMKPETIPENTGGKIRKLCIEKSISQIELARRTGLNYRTIGAIVSGYHEPRKSTLEKIAVALDVNAQDLYPKD